MGTEDETRKLETARRLLAQASTAVAMAALRLPPSFHQEQQICADVVSSLCALRDHLFAELAVRS